MTNLTRRGLARAAGAAVAAAMAPRASRAAAPVVTQIDRVHGYPEGLLVADDGLYMADIAGERLIAYDIKTFARARILRLEHCGPTAIAPFGEGGLLVNCHLAGQLLALTARRTLDRTIGHTVDGKPIPWPNDTTGDGAGGAFVTSAGLFDRGAPATGAVVHIGRDFKARVLAGGLHYANGITYDPKTRELFVTEHFENRVWKYQLTASFDVERKTEFFNLSGLPAPSVPAYGQMGPDNLRLRANGDLIVPQYGAGRFIIVSRDGALKQIVDVPCQFITDTVELDGDILFIGAFSLEPRAIEGMLGRVHWSHDGP